ncbi:adenylate/guanylate cyclase domain-containing protein [Desulfobacterales bacterium HSG16]|nr:adenylate/guanylate cyclase domain-containing protein [Desulfobacterales bacterium HSG16]
MSDLSNKDKKNKNKCILCRVAIPIWLQLSLVTMLIIFCTTISLGYLFFQQEKEQLFDQTVKIGMVSLHYFTSNSRIPLIQDNTLRLNTLIREALEIDGILHAIIIDNNMKIKAHTDHDKIDQAFRGFGIVENQVQKGDITYFEYISPSEQHVLNLNRPIVFKNKKLGEVHVGVSIDFIERLIREKTESVIWLTSIITFFGILIALGLGFRFSRPIAELVHATREIGKGNYQYKVEMNRNDELGNLAASFNRMSRELWTKSLMQKSFGKYVGHEVLEMIMADPENEWLKCRRCRATMLFTDIRGFTAYSEVNVPEVVVEQLNQYFQIATGVILEYGGYVDKFIGDAVLGIFGVPIYHKDHMERAVRAAVKMQEIFSKSSKDGNLFLASIGIGIHTGEVVSGNIGSHVKMEYTVIGDSVNVASRLNGLAEAGEIVISKDIYEQLKHRIVASPRPIQTIKGRAESIETFLLKGMKDDKDIDDFIRDVKENNIP